MNVGSLFSGIGGIELGFKRAGFKTEWFVENNPHAQAVLRKRFPTTQIYDDITTIDFRNLPRVDILTGGFPCQDISNAGKRIGISGSRSGLWKHYLRAISEIRPKYVLIENVAALLSRGLNVVLADLASVGYDAEWHCISASSVGAPHKRERVFILAYPNSCGCVYGQAQEQSTEARKYAQCEFKSSGSDVADSYISGVELQIDAQRRKSNTFRSNYWEWNQEIYQYRGGWWAVEPSVGRVVDGIPLRVDRIKRLGNAVVPACAQIFAQAIKKQEE